VRGIYTLEEYDKEQIIATACQKETFEERADYVKLEPCWTLKSHRAKSARN